MCQYLVLYFYETEHLIISWENLEEKNFLWQNFRLPKRRLIFKIRFILNLGTRKTSRDLQ